MNHTLRTKEKIFQAALSEFNVKGYTGTSIREIATAAEMNVSTISYYFKGKHGLLKFAFISFFEPYIHILEDCLLKYERDSATICLKNAIIQLMDYQYRHFELARFVWREVSIDSQIVRETMTTYFRKERYLFQTIIDKGIKNGEFNKVPIGIIMTQLKGIMTMPFLNSIYTSEVWNIYYQERFYLKKYKEQIIHWIDFYLSNKKVEAV
ncbi:forespore capture DNA-binding protein RefZ [Bacillus andreraoultii]|uniref:forespore capture DNA-binding protein RefZ n=1 Tax=Bacillus andreraoultii TaxID=1499685 RepID=UPI00053B9B7A|nr:forespore capture DNA-binding protein RefZ [Bacillus andreraoultii]